MISSQVVSRLSSRADSSKHSADSNGLMRFVATMRHIKDAHEEHTNTKKRRAGKQAGKASAKRRKASSKRRKASSPSTTFEHSSTGNGPDAMSE